MGTISQYFSVECIYEGHKFCFKTLTTSSNLMKFQCCNGGVFDSLCCGVLLCWRFEVSLSIKDNKVKHLSAIYSKFIILHAQSGLPLIVWRQRFWIASFRPSTRTHKISVFKMWHCLDRFWNFLFSVIVFLGYWSLVPKGLNRKCIGLFPFEILNFTFLKPIKTGLKIKIRRSQLMSWTFYIDFKIEVSCCRYLSAS